MRFFDHYVSNTSAGSGNQLFFLNDDPREIQKGRLLYKIFKGGKYKYSFLFSNIIDSTFSNGVLSSANMICDEWHIDGAGVCICDACELEDMDELKDFVSLTFDGNDSKLVHPGEFFASDAVELDAQSGQFLCLEISFHGKMIPYHEETIIPTFLLKNNVWKSANHMPFPAMIGCNKNVDARIAFLGDSITQGIGTENNSYMHWNARLAEMLGDRYAYWNLGIGYGRAADAATDGAWLFKAKQNDIVFVCYGVNDIMQGYSAEQIKTNLKRIVCKLKECGIKVVLQTIPPFDYDEVKKPIWIQINTFIKNELSEYCDLVYDNVPVLADEKRGSHFAKYNGHPNAEGCALWAKSLFEFLNDSGLHF